MTANACTIYHVSDAAGDVTRVAYEKGKKKGRNILRQFLYRAAEYKQKRKTRIVRDCMKCIWKKKYELLSFEKVLTVHTPVSVCSERLFWKGITILYENFIFCLKKFSKKR